MQLEVSDLFFSYDETDVLKSVSFCADRGERIAVLGPNGVGKSTLFRCLLGFLEPKRGSVKIAGHDVRDYSRRALAAELAYIPQSYSPAFDHTVLDSVLMGLGAQLGPFDRPSREQTDAALRILDELGIGALASRGCMRISGGERLSNADGELLPGMVCRVEASPAGAAEEIALPVRAVQQAGDGSRFVWKVSGDSVVRTAVATGRLVNNAVTITAGIQAGDRIVTDGMQKIGQGSKVIAE